MSVLQRPLARLRNLNFPRDLDDLMMLRKAPTERLQMETVALWCEALSARMRGGDTLARAVAETPCGHGLAAHLDPLRLRIQRGMDLVTACSTLLNETERTATDRNLNTSPIYWRETLGLIRVCALGGAETARTLDKVARNLRVKEAVAQEVRAQTASARLSAGLLTALPAVAVVATVLISPSSARMYANPVGLWCLAASLILNTAGWIWIRSLLRSVES